MRDYRGDLYRICKNYGASVSAIFIGHIKKIAISELFTALAAAEGRRPRVAFRLPNECAYAETWPCIPICNELWRRCQNLILPRGGGGPGLSNADQDVAISSPPVRWRIVLGGNKRTGRKFQSPTRQVIDLSDTLRVNK